MIFLKKILEDRSPFCGANDTPVLDLWRHLLQVVMSLIMSELDPFLKYFGN